MFKVRAEAFCTQLVNQQHFAIGLKIFPLDNRVVSVHIIILRIEKGIVLDRHEEEEDHVPEDQVNGTNKIDQDIKPVATGKKDKLRAEKASPTKVNLFKHKRVQMNNP